MAKKRKKSKSKEQVPFIVFSAEAEPQDLPGPASRIHSFIASEPGWKAVFAPCVSCETSGSQIPVVFWAVVEWSDGPARITGLCGGRDGDFWQADMEHTFVGYAAPGESPEEILSDFFGTSNH